MTSPAYNRAAWPNTWREFAKAYYAHHFGCQACIAAGQGLGLRCAVGAPLWAKYQEAAA